MRWFNDDDNITIQEDSNELLTLERMADECEDSCQEDVGSVCDTTISFDQVRCVECDVEAEDYDGQWAHNNETQEYLCGECHQDGLRRQKDEANRDLSSTSTETLPNSSPMPVSEPSSPIAQKRSRRRPTNEANNTTPVLTRSRSNMLGLRPRGGL